METGISCRNQWEGKIIAIQPGAVNAEVEVEVAGGDRIAAIVTSASIKNLDLAVGKPVVVLVKAPWVMLQAGSQKLRLSARNQLAGKITRLQRGAVNSEVEVTCPGGAVVVAVVTNDAVEDLALKVGDPATALIKASHVVLGVR